MERLAEQGALGLTMEVQDGGLRGTADGRSDASEVLGVSPWHRRCTTDHPHVDAMVAHCEVIGTGRVRDHFMAHRDLRPP